MSTTQRGRKAHDILGKIALHISRAHDLLRRSKKITAADHFVFEVAEQYLHAAYIDTTAALETKSGRECLQDLVNGAASLPPKMSIVTLSVAQLGAILAMAKATGEDTVHVFDHGEEISALVEIQRTWGESRVQEIYRDTAVQVL